MGRQFYNAGGKLKMTERYALRPTSLQNLLQQQHQLPAEQATALAAFFGPMLRYDPRQRPSAAMLLKHEFLTKQAAELAKKQRAEKKKAAAAKQAAAS